MTDMTDLVEIKLAIQEMRGDIQTLRAEFNAGDKDAISSVRLLAQSQENQSKALAETRQDLKEVMRRFDERTEQYREFGRSQATAVRKDLEKQLDAHETADAPHDASLGQRIRHLESFRSMLVGAMLLANGLGLTGILLVFNKT